MELKIDNILYGKKTKKDIPFLVVHVTVLDKYWSKHLGNQTAFCLFNMTSDDIDFRINDHINLKGYRIKNGDKSKMIGNVTLWEVLSNAS